MYQKSNFKYYAALVLSVMFWASGIIVTKLTIDGIGPLALCFLRALIAFLFLLPFSLPKGFHFKMLFTKNALIYGFFGYGGNLVFLTYGLKYCSANISSIIHGLFPVFMIFFGALLLSEGINRFKVLGMVFSIIGVIIATLGDLGSKDATLVGILFVATSVVTWAFYSVYAKKTAASLDPFILTQVCLGAAVLLIFPLLLIEIFVSGFPAPSGPTMISALYLGVICGGVAIILWNYGLRKISSAVSGVYFNLMPAFGLIFAYFIGESINAIQIIGSIFIFVGVLIGTSSEFKKRTLC